MSQQNDPQHKEALVRAVQSMLEPLANLMMECGIGVGEFHAAAKLTFVNSARRMERDGQRPHISRIASITGLTRNEVAQLLADGVASPRTAYGVNRAERVLQGWWNDPDYVDPAGVPLILPIRGAKRSFAALVKKHSGDARVNTLLDELCRVKAVRQLPGKRVEAVSRTTATVRWSPDGLVTLGQRLRAQLETLIHNVKNPSLPLYERQIANTKLDPKFAAMLIRDMTQQIDVTVSSMDDHLNDPRVTLRGLQAQHGGMQLGMGFYLFKSNDVSGPSALEAQSTEPIRSASTVQKKNKKR